MAKKRGLTVLLGSAILCAPVLVCAQGASQAQGYMGPDEAAAQPAAAQPSGPLPGDADYVEPQQGLRQQAQATAPDQEVIQISAPRYRRIHEARFPGSPNRGNPMRQFPGELPEKTVYGVPWNIEGLGLDDAHQSQALPTSPTGFAVPDTLNP